MNICDVMPNAMPCILVLHSFKRINIVIMMMIVIVMIIKIPIMVIIIIINIIMF